MIEEIIALLSEKKHVFLTGGAGVGKSYSIKEIVKTFLAQGKKSVTLASTGMAAVNVSGQTVHSFFKIGICASIDELKANRKHPLDSSLKKLLKNLDLIVIDEISMISSGVFELISFRLKQGGFEGALLVVGDFLQLPPIANSRKISEHMQLFPLNSVEEVFGYAFESSAWQEFDFKPIVLEKVYRTEDEEFVAVLNAIRFANLSVEQKFYIWHRVQAMPEQRDEYSFLYPKNADVHLHNAQELEKLESEKIVFHAMIEIEDKHVDDKEVNRFFDEARIVKELELKEGAKVLFTRNSWKFYNGERGVVVKIDTTNDVVYVKRESGSIIGVERETFKKSAFKTVLVDNELQIEEKKRFEVMQFPLSLSYALTIHKSQGMSLSKVVIDVENIFAPSQFYVAISRAVNPNDLILLASKESLRRCIRIDEKAAEFYKALQE